MGWFSWVKNVVGKVGDGIKNVIGKVSDVGRNVVGKVSGVMDTIKDTASRVSNMPIIGDVLSQVAASNPTVSNIVSQFNKVDDAIKNTSKKIWGDTSSMNLPPPITTT